MERQVVDRWQPGEDEDAVLVDQPMVIAAGQG
jgi:hypothetical protein